MLVSDAMSTDLVTCSVNASLREAVERMLSEGVGSSVVYEDEAPIGIVTETDALHSVCSKRKLLSEISVNEVMSSPVVKVSKDKTLRHAARKMRKNEIKKLVVVDDMEFVGIVTTQDIIYNYHQLKSEIHDVTRSWKRNGRTI